MGLPMKNAIFTVDEKKRKVAELTSLFLYKHYCENDTELLISHMDDEFLWFGAAEHEYIVGAGATAACLRSFSGKIPRCHISDEHFDVIQPVEDMFVCTGRAWICTDPSSDTYLRVHQRITSVFRWTGDGLRCCHIHLSNPYVEMDENDVGFPEKMSRESRKYFREQIEAQKKKIEEQHAFIMQIYYKDLSTDLYNRNKFNQLCEALRSRDCGSLGVAYFDLNGLKQTNDLMGHRAGDELICRVAEHLHQVFRDKAYRIGGDEFIVLDLESDENAFYSKIRAVSSAMKDDDISVSLGISWRAVHGDIDEQINEADQNMYRAKHDFYARGENNRRQR